MSDQLLDDRVIEFGRSWISEVLGESAAGLSAEDVAARIRSDYPGGPKAAIEAAIGDGALVSAGKAGTAEGEKAWRALASNGWQTRDTNQAVITYRSPLGRLVTEQIDVKAVPRRMAAQAKLEVPTRAYDAYGNLIGGVVRRHGKWAGW